MLGKIRIPIFAASLALGMTSTHAQVIAPTKGYVVGYVPFYSLPQPDFTKYTHIILAFLRPSNGNGDLRQEGEFGGNIGAASGIIQAAHAANRKVLISIGGHPGEAPYQNEMVAMVGNESARTNFVNNVVNYMNSNNLDGVDIDWEQPTNVAEGQGWGLLVRKFREKLGSGKLLTAAVPGTGGGVNTYKFYPPADLKLCDFISIMSFDYLHASQPEHSPYLLAQTDLKNYLRILDRKQIVLGIPLYGKALNVLAVPYNTIAGYGLAPDVDKYSNYTFNGPVTVKKKATYVAENGYAGCMFWEVGSDQGGILISQAIEGLKAPPKQPSAIKMGKTGNSILSISSLYGSSISEGQRDVRGRSSSSFSHGTFYLPPNASRQ